MGKKDSSITPIRKQYLSIKKNYPDTILFFRLGDFYETFDQDAEVVSRELDIVLTSRNVAKGVRVPMAGIPYHAVENYLSRLISKGYHVAICEQVSDQPINGLMQREVVRIVTPGTILEPELLPGDANNYLAAVVIDENKGAIAYVDISTGEFAVTEIKSASVKSDLRAEIIRLKPAEILLPEGMEINGDLPFHITSLPDWRFETSRNQLTLERALNVSTLAGYGLNGKSLAISAAGVVVEYLEQTQPAAAKLLDGISVYNVSEFMALDAATRRNLELTETIRGGELKGSLLGVLDRTITPMGKRLIRQWVSKPLLDIDEINRRLCGITIFFENGLLRSEIRQNLKGIMDLERLATRIQSGVAQPRDLVALRETLRKLPTIKHLLLESLEEESEFVRGLNLCSEELSLVEQAITDEPPAVLGNIGIIRPGFSRKLDGIYQASKHAREWIANLEKSEREKTGIKSLKVGYNKVFGYYIEVTKSNTHMVPAHYIRKQTLVNAERYITPEMKEYETLVLNAEEEIKETEKQVFGEVCRTLSKSVEKILSSAHAIAELDVLASLADVAAHNNYVKPTVVDDDVLEIHDGRHPVVEQMMETNRFVPNDAIFEPGERIRIITGPNMSGKSTFLRQVALIVLMAQIGSYVPASSAKIGLVDRIFTRIGAQDEIHAGQSTFMVEMIETANILHHATKRSLLILDEIGRGTSTYDGVSIAWAVVEYIHNHPKLQSKTLFATHYHELTQLAELLPGVRNYNIAVSEADGKVVFLRKIVPGGADKSYGIHVAQLAGLPRPVIQRAEEILKELERTTGRAISSDTHVTRQLMLFPDTNPLLEELKELDINTLSPIEALNRLYEWKSRFVDESEDSSMA